MSVSEFACAPGHERAIEWALSRLDAAHLETVSESSWACTYRLTDADRSLYLKVVPPVQRPAVRRVLAVSQQFGAQVPAVVAAEPDEGWILTADHGGRPPVFEETDELLEVVRRYAQMQAQASAAPAFLACLERIDPSRVMDDLLAFLARPSNADGSTSALVGAAYFVGDDDAARYQRLFATRAVLLQSRIARCATLPPTVSHGDLHRWNVAIRPDGDVMFFDWDEVAAGPAGLCLHGLFEGSTHATMLLDRLADGHPLPDSALGTRLQAYLQGLSDGGYAPRDALLSALPGALAAGEVRFVASFGRYPGEAQREAAANTIRIKLSDLLDLCDWLACRDLETAFAFADDYERGQEWRRAHRLVQHLLSNSPQDASLLARYGTLCMHLGDLATAQEAFQEAATIDPSYADAVVGLARTSLAHLDFTAATARIDAVLSAQPAHAGALALRERVRQMQQVISVADQPQGLPRWSVSDEERAAGQLAPDTLALLVAMFRRYGVVQLDGVFSPAHIERMQAGFIARNASQFHDGDHPDALQVGDKRIMLTMELDELFGDPGVVASGLLLPFMRRVLGKECILSAYTAVISLPGSADQRIHKDHSELFEEEGWQLEHPSFAAQVIFPLLELNEVTGATRIFKGSQRVPLRKCSDLPSQDPVVPLGSCVLLDYSVAHYGRGNQSDQVRPIVNMIYSRPWFRDCRNYHIQPPLKFAPGYFENAPEPVRELVAWWDLERRTAALASSTAATEW